MKKKPCGGTTSRVRVNPNAIASSNGYKLHYSFNDWIKIEGDKDDKQNYCQVE